MSEWWPVVVLGIFFVSAAILMIVVGRRERAAWNAHQRRLDEIHQEWEERRAMLDRRAMERRWGVNFDFDSRGERESEAE